MKVSGMEMLTARENRAAAQKILLSSGHCLISFTMNIPGTVKTSELILRSFRQGATWIDDLLARSGTAVLKRELRLFKTGPEGFWLVDGDPYKIKMQMIEIEISCEIGRLFDMDVLASDMHSISRTAFGYPPRQCLICDQPAHVCSRSQRHDRQKLIQKSQEIMETYFCIPKYTGQL